MKNFSKLVLPLLILLSGVWGIEANAQSEADVIDISSARSNEFVNGDTVTIKGIITRSKGRLSYIQDLTAAIAIFDNDQAFSDSVQAGDSILVKGVRADFRTLEEITAVEVTVLSTGNDLPTPQLITVAELNANGEQYESELIQIDSLSVTETGVWAPSRTYTASDTDGNEAAIRTPSDSDTDISGQPIPSGNFTFTGVIGAFDDVYQLSPILPTDIEGEGSSTGPDLSTIAEARAVENGTQVKIQGFVTRALGRETRLQDGTAGISIFSSGGDFFDAVGDSSIAPGDFIEIVGTRSDFRTLEQLSPALFNVLSRGNAIPVPQNVTIAEILTNGEAYESEVIQIDSLTLDVTGVWESSTNYFAVGPAGDTITIRTPSSSGNSIDGEPIPTDIFSFRGVLGSFDSVYQLVPVLPTDIISGSEPSTLLSIKEAREVANGSLVTIKGVVTRTLGRQTRIQDSTGAIGVFASSGDFADAVANGDIAPGDSILMDGIRSDFNELQQLNSVSFTVLSRGNALPEVQTLTIADILANGEEYESELIRIEGLKVNSFGVWDDNRNYDALDGVDTLTLRIGNSRDTELEGLPIPLTAFDFEGVLGEFRGTYQLTPVLETDIQAASSSAFTLQILHNNDGESELLPDDNGLGGAATFKATVDQVRSVAATQGLTSVTLSSGDNFLPGPEFNASLALPDTARIYDAIVLDAIAYDALCIGNHDFDFGPDILERLILDFETNTPPYLSANLDFTAEPGLQALVDSGRIASRTIIERDGERIGVVGLTTPALENISSPRNVVVNADIVGIAQAEIDALTADGVNKIILISHLQSITQEKELAAQLNNVDIIIAGGGDELLTNDPSIALEGQEVFGSYPLDTTDVDGDAVYIVTTPGEYKFLGNLIVEFDTAGVVTSINSVSNPILVGSDSNIDPDSALVVDVQEPVEDYVESLALNVIGSTQVALDGTRGGVRSRETNQGNLIADALLWEALRTGPGFGLDTTGNIVCMQNGGGIRNNEVIPAGSDISELTTFDMLPFSNQVSVINPLSAADFLASIENAVSLVEEGNGRFSQVAGFSFSWNPDSARGSRVIDVTLDDGTAVVANGEIVADPAFQVSIVTNSFVATGQDGFELFGEAGALQLPVSYQRALFNYIVEALPDGVITAEQYPSGGEGRINEIREVAFSLRVVHNNDGESQLVPDNNGFGGAARFKTVVDSLKAEALPTITLSSGDNFLPGPEFNASLALDESERIYDAIVLDAIGYDALCLGNHDFDFGPDILERLILDFETATPPYLSANLDFSAEPGLQALVDAGRIAPQTVVSVGGDSVGVIGLTTPQLDNISSPRDVVVDPAIVEIAQAEVDSLIAAGINKIILISHLQSINEELELATQLTGVDVIIAGGGDELLTNDSTIALPGQSVFGAYPLVQTDAAGKLVYVVTTPGNYRFVGNLLVDFDDRGEVISIDAESNPIRVDSTITADSALVVDVQTPVEEYTEGLAQNIIATTEPALDGVRPNVRSKETNQGNLIADALLWQALELADEFNIDTEGTYVVGFQNGGGIRNDEIIPAGSDISELTTFDMLPFANFVSFVNPLNAEQFFAVMENAVSLLEDGAGRFAQISGFEVVVDSTAERGERIVSITMNDSTPVVVNGVLVQDEDFAVTVVTNSFTAAGGDGNDEFEAAGFNNLPVSYQRALFNYIVEELEGNITAAQYPEGGEGRTRYVEELGFTLQILHNNDGESKLRPDENGLGGAPQFKAYADFLRSFDFNSVTLSSGDNFLAGPEFNASLALPDTARLYDAVVLDAIGYDALCIGNHDFDFGPDVLERLILDFETTQPPYLSANLDFTAEPGLQALVDIDRIASRTVIERDGEQIGVVGLTTPQLDIISSPGAVEVNDAIATIAQAEVDALIAEGINKIILISHLQSINEELELAGQLTGVDIIIAGGGDELLTNDDENILEGVSKFGSYPLTTKDADSTDVYVVTTPGNYRFIGNLIINFDDAGVVTEVNPISDLVLVQSDADIAPDSALIADVLQPVEEFIAGRAQNIIATTEPALDGIRANVRSKETNQGNLIADAFLWTAFDIGPEFGLDTTQNIVAVQNGGGIRNDEIIPAGSDISELKTFEILPFPNFVSWVNPIDAEGFKGVMENWVSQIENGAGRFSQIAGFTMVVDTTGTPDVDRITDVIMDDGTVIVQDGFIVAPEGFEVVIVTNSFSASGQEGNDEFGVAGFNNMGVSYDRALFNYIVDGLDGFISAAQYPEGGEGRIVFGTTSIDDQLAAGQVLNFRAYPNPASSDITFTYQLPEATQVEIKVFDMLGAEVATLAQETQIGEQQINWDLSTARGPLANGMYTIRLVAGERLAVKRIAITK